MEGDFYKLAIEYKDIDNLLFAEINVLANEIDVSVEGYPTLKLFLAGDKKNSIDYLEKRLFVNMKDFLNEKLGLNMKDESFQQGIPKSGEL
jgi:hypothetical protein